MSRFRFLLSISLIAICFSGLASASDKEPVCAYSPYDSVVYGRDTAPVYILGGQVLTEHEAIGFFPGRQMKVEEGALAWCESISRYAGTVKRQTSHNKRKSVDWSRDNGII